MANLYSEPKLVPRAFKDGSGWFIQVTWDDGTRVPEQIGGFLTHSEAREWITLKSTAYFEARKP
jgi:hypothetical protein